MSLTSFFLELRVISLREELKYIGLGKASLLASYNHVRLISPPMGPMAHWALDSRLDRGRPAR
jgi:hypothetical protein